ncbi:hypothetical protein J3A83DRAFT_2976199 [Scleroderma citrinum]
MYNALAARQSSYDPSGLPAVCQSACGVITDMTMSCSADLACLCSHSIQTCMTCIARYEPSSTTDAQSALESYNQACGTSLTVGFRPNLFGVLTDRLSLLAQRKLGSTSSGSGSSSGGSQGALGGKTGGVSKLMITARGFTVAVACAVFATIMVL